MVSIFQGCHKNLFSWEWPVSNSTPTPLATGCLAVCVPTLNVNNFFISEPIIKPFDSRKVKMSRICLVYETPC